MEQSDSASRLTLSSTISSVCSPLPASRLFPLQIAPPRTETPKQHGYGYASTENVSEQYHVAHVHVDKFASASRRDNHVCAALQPMLSKLPLSPNPSLPSSVCRRVNWHQGKSYQGVCEPLRATVQVYTLALIFFLQQRYPNQVHLGQACLCCRWDS